MEGAKTLQKKTVENIEEGQKHEGTWKTISKMGKIKGAQKINWGGGKKKEGLGREKNTKG